MLYKLFYKKSGENPDVEYLDVVYAFDSYMVADEDLQDTSKRLLEVDNKLYLPIEMNIRVLVTSSDVLHC
jgi:heme/copper-type cytochrome/quinol oxidase subunit 2